MSTHSEIAPRPTKVERQRQRLIIALLRSHQLGATDLAVALARRRPHSPFGSDACPVRQIQVQTAMIKTVDTVLGRGAPLWAASWIPHEHLIPTGGLGGFDLGRFVATRRRALQRAFPSTPAFGVVNLSQRVTADDRIAWVLQVRLLLEAADTKGFRELFLGHCRSDRNVARSDPFLALGDGNRAEYLSAVTEPMSYTHMQKVDFLGLRAPVLQTLTGEAAVEAALFHDRYPLERRLILRRLRRVRDHSGFGLKRSPKYLSRLGSMTEP